MAVIQPDAWSAFWVRLEQLHRRLQRSRNVRVSDRTLRTESQEVALTYFREIRNYMSMLGFTAREVEELSTLMSRLLTLAESASGRSGYLKVMTEVRDIRPQLASRREMLIGERSQRYAAPGAIALEDVERRILETLREMLPSAALSYEQAVRDLRVGDRISLRGTAVELREALRELLDHLAPDEQVQKMAGYRTEEHQNGPTMRQKARFILRSRRLPESAQLAPEDTVALVEAATSNLVRSTYQRGSLGTHVAGALGAARQLKMYVDSVLAELLQIHTAQGP